MSKPLETISLIPKAINQIQMSEQLFTELKLENDKELPIRIGKKTISTSVQITDTAATNEIIIPEKLMKKFSLPISTYTFQARLLPEEYTLHLGPIVGVVTDFHINEQNEPQFRSIHMFCEELHHGITATGGFFYIFSHDELDQLGYYFKDGKWEPAILPLPDVIYNRVHSRKLEYSTSFKNFRRRLQHLSIPIFNDRFLSKWEVYEKLNHQQHLQPFLPETKLFSIENLVYFSEKFETIFIKPIHGSLGRNIFKLTKTDSHHFLVQSTSQSLTDHFYSIDEISPLLGNRIYMIQQGIQFRTLDGSTTDFRVLCHKNALDDWEVTSLVARVSGEQEIVSNLARGGKVIKPYAVLTAFTDRQKASEILSLIKEVAIAICAIISKSSSGITGELGIDIGIDPDGKPWLIEVNSKPSKSFEDGQQKIRPSAKAIIAFCRLLTFPNKQEEEEET